MGQLNRRLDRLEKGLRAHPADPESDAALWAVLNDPASLDLRDQQRAAVAAGETVRAAELDGRIDARLEAIAGGVS